jgi:autotransporter-associated beta strand protein
LFAGLFAFVCSWAWAEVIDLNGVARTVGADEYAAEFTNTSETLAELTIDAAEPDSFSGKISGNVKLVKTGTAQLDITTVNDFTGGVDLKAGTINFTVAGSLGSGKVTISNGATLQLGAAVECSNSIHLMASESIVKFAVNNVNGFFSGDITGESGITFAPQISAKGKYYSFTSAITIPEGVLSTPGQKLQESYITFKGPVSVKTVKQSSSSNRAALKFLSSQNSWTSFVLNRASGTYAPFFAEGAIPNESYIKMEGSNSRGVEIQGNQKFKYITHSKSDRTSVITAISKSTVTLGSEVEATGSQSGTAYIFAGSSLSLVYSPENADSPWTIASGASTMTGALTVNRGVLSIEGTATFANVPQITVNESGVFSCTSTGTTPLKSLKHIELSEEATFNVGEGIEISLDSFLVDGKPPRAFGWFTGSDNENPVEGDQKSIPQITGTGRIYIPFQGGATEATWDGGAGESDTLVTTAANWDGDTLPDFEGGLTATFATGGKVATFTSVSSLDALNFSAEEGFTLNAQDENAKVVLANGIAVAENSGETVVTNTLDVPLHMTGEQNWQTPANTVLEVREKVSSEAATKLTFDGEGTYAIYSTNTFTGSILLSKGTTRVYSKEGAFGLPSEGNRVELNHKTGGELCLYGTTIEKDFVLTKYGSTDNGAGGLYFAAGSSNVFAGTVTIGDNWAPVFPKDACIVFKNGGRIGTYFRPDGTKGGVKLIFDGKPVSFGTGSQFYGGVTTFKVSSNYVDAVYVRVNTHLDLQAPDCFKNTPDLTMANQSGRNESYIRLNGNDQAFGNLNIANPYGYITTSSDKPATLAFDQTSDWTPRADVFQGPISLSKGGTATVTINSSLLATGGDLTVRGGTLAFGESGVLSSVTNITVSGEGSLVTLVSKANLPNHKKSILRLNDGGKLQIPSGMNLKVAELYIDGYKRRDGNYTAGNAADIVAGEGSLIVGSPAFKIIIR